MKASWDAIKGKIWLYTDGSGMEPTSGFAKSMTNGYVIMEDGLQIPEDEFYDYAEPLVDDGSSHGQQAHKTRNDEKHEQMGRGAGEGRQIIDQMVGQTDAMGIPLLKTEASNNEQNQKPTIPSEVINKPNANIPVSPLIALIEKSKKTDRKISITIEVPLIDKKVYNLLSETYGDEEMEIVIQHMINKIGDDKVKDAFESKIIDFYAKKKTGQK